MCSTMRGCRLKKTAKDTLTAIAKCFGFALLLLSDATLAESIFLELDRSSGFRDYMTNDMKKNGISENAQKRLGWFAPVFIILRDAPVIKRKREIDLYALFNEVVKGSNDGAKIGRLYAKVWPRNKNSYAKDLMNADWKTKCPLADLFSDPRRLHSHLHSLLKTDNADDGQRLLSFISISEKYSHILKWVEEPNSNCTDAVKTRFRKATEQSVTNGLEILVCVARQVISLDKKGKRKTLRGHLCNQLKFSSAKGYEKEFTEKFYSRTSLDNMDNFYSLWETVSIGMPGTTVEERKGHFSSVLVRVSNYLVHEKGAIFESSAEPIQKFLEAFVPLLIYTIHCGKAEVPEVNAIVEEYVGFYGKDINLWEEAEEYGDIDYEKYGSVRVGDSRQQATTADDTRRQAVTGGNTRRQAATGDGRLREATTGGDKHRQTAIRDNWRRQSKQGRR